MAKTLTNSGDMVEIVYLGKQQTSVWDGSVTNTRYRFGVGRERGWVYKSDAGERGKGSGFLNVKGSQGEWLFDTAAVEEQSEPVVNTVQVQEALPEPTVLVSEEPVVAESSVVEAETPVENETAVSDQVNYSEFNVKEIMGMDLSKEDLRKVYEAELVSERPRKSLITWLEEQLASE